MILYNKNNTIQHYGTETERIKSQAKGVIAKVVILNYTYQSRLMSKPLITLNEYVQECNNF